MLLQACFYISFGGENKLSKEVTLTFIELGISILVEGIILALVFNFISERAQKKQEQNLQNEMQNMEKQIKFDFEQSMKAIEQARTDIISQIKESSEPAK